MMSDLWTLIKFEYKKIFQKKSSWIALIVVYLFILLGGVLMEIGSIEAEAEKISSNYEDMKAQKKEELSLVFHPRKSSNYTVEFSKQDG